MLLADHGAEVLKIEPPGGDPFRSLPGSNAWLRGRRSAVLDLADLADRAVALDHVRAADVVIASYAPDVATKLGVDAATLTALNPRLVYCSITGYGDHADHRDRPALDALVAARLGVQWEQRGWLGGPIGHRHDNEDFLSDLEIPDGMEPGSPREGPIFSYSPWPSLATAFLASVGINAALVARESTGRGQIVATSMLQAVMALTTTKLQRAEHSDAPRFRSWIYDRRSPKGFFECSDGRWIEQWVPNPNFLLSSADGDTLAVRDGSSNVRDDPNRIEPDPYNLVVLAHYFPLMAEAVARFPSDDWVRVAAQAGVPLQSVRTPEEALCDPALIADGAVADVASREHGQLRQVGLLYGLDKTPGRVHGGVPAVGEHTEVVRNEQPARQAPVVAPSWPRATARGPLDGVVVLDLGFAVAGPYGCQVLADLGATVIKVNAPRDPWWHAMHIAFGANRGKRSICLDLKKSAGLATFHRLVEKADVVHSNMRPDALRRLRCDETSLREINPQIVYCHTRGFDRGPRSDSPGNDQTGCSLAGVTYEDGGTGDGGRPFWSLTSLGDTGNGFLSAIGVLQALFHRARTGEGQFVDTSILNAGLLVASAASLRPDGSSLPRPRLDGMQLGLSPLYRLYETADGWLCIAVLNDHQWRDLIDVVGNPPELTSVSFGDAAGAPSTATMVANVLERHFRERDASTWFKALDTRGVPCEVSTTEYEETVFEDPEMLRLGYVSSHQHPVVGRYDSFGTLIDFSETPGTIWGPPPLVGQHSREILAEFGFTEPEIEQLVAESIVFDTLHVTG
jgi:crotonobetainyl-CoA:carnitine CoA-transferase CaiB-like acyl-CoA transferase